MTTIFYWPFDRRPKGIFLRQPMSVVRSPCFTWWAVLKAHFDFKQPSQFHIHFVIHTLYTSQSATNINVSHMKLVMTLLHISYYASKIYFVTHSSIDFLKSLMTCILLSIIYQCVSHSYFCVANSFLNLNVQMKYNT